MSSYNEACATAAMGQPLCWPWPSQPFAWVRVAVATTTAGDHLAPLGRPWAPLLGRQGAGNSLLATLVGALGARWLVVLPARRACCRIHPFTVACTVLAALHACRGLRRRVLPQSHKEFYPPSGSAATTTTRAARRASREAHRLARHGTTGAHQKATAGTALGPCSAVRRPPLPVGPGLLPARRRATTKCHTGRSHGRRLCGACLIPPRPGESPSTEICATRRSSSGC